MMKIILNLALAGYLLLGSVVTAEEDADGKTATAIFAGGCFWCMEGPFDSLPGVISTIPGYSGGDVENPTYEDVSSGKTGHSEVVQVTYAPTIVSYEKLLELFWQNIDPLDDQGQFCDKGEQYKAVIFYRNENEKKLAEASLKTVQAKFPGQAIATAIRPAGKFFPAEDYHQDYYLNNSNKYKFYRFTCGRDQRLEEIWGG